MIAIAVVVAPVSAQSFSWANTMGGSQIDEATAIAQDAAGNIYTTGNFRGNFDFDPGPGVTVVTASGATNTFIAKFSSAGDFQWVKTLGGPGPINTSALAVDAMGDLLATGWFNQTTDFDPGPGTAFLSTSTPSANTFILKLNSLGDFVWAKSFDSSSFNSGRAIAADSAGNVYTTGTFRGSQDFDPGPGTFIITGPFVSSTFVSKLDSAGNFVWARGLTGTDQNEGLGIVLDAAGDVHIAGQFTATLDFDPGPGIANRTAIGSRDGFVLKLSSAGLFSWVSTLRSLAPPSPFGFQSSTCNAITLDNAGNVCAAGSFSNAVDFDPSAGVTVITGSQQASAFVWKLTSAGDLVWARAMGGPVGCIGLGIATDTGGSTYTTGWYAGPVDFDPGVGIYSRTTLAQRRNVFISKLSDAGAFDWVSVLAEDASFAQANGIVVNAAGDTYTAGWFVAVADFDPGSGVVTRTSAGARDIFLSKLSPRTLPPQLTRVSIGCDPITGMITCSSDPAFVGVGGSIEFSVGAQCGATTVSVPGLGSPIVIAPGATSAPQVVASSGLLPYTASMTPPGFPLATRSCEIRAVQTLLTQDGAPFDLVTTSSADPIYIDVNAPAGSGYFAALSHQCQLPGIPFSPFIPAIELDISSPLFQLSFPVNTLAPFVQGMTGDAATQQIYLLAPPIPQGTPPVTTYLQAFTFSPLGLTGISQKVQVNWGP